MSSLSGLTELRDLDLENNQVSDISAFTSLKKLTALSLGGNPVGDISALSELTDLTELYLRNCGLKDITPLAGLTKLSLLYITGNDIVDISALCTLVQNVEYLENLQIQDNYLNLTDGSQAKSVIDAIKNSPNVRAAGFKYSPQKALEDIPFKAKAGSKGAYRIELSWDRLPDTVYEIVRMGGRAAKNIELPDNKDTAYVDTNVMSGTEYTYTIKAHIWQGEDAEPVIIQRTVSAETDTVFYTITASVGEGGSISPSGMVPAVECRPMTFTITPDAGYRIASVLVDGEDKGVVASYTFDDVRGPHTIHADFEINHVPQTLTDGGSGISVSGNISEGAVLTIKNMILGSSAADNAIREHMTDKDYVLIWSGDISLTGSFTGALTISLPMSAQYNGQTVIVMHAKKDGSLETYNVVVQDGCATFEVTSLSPFAVFLKDERDDIPRTGDSSTPWVWWLLGGISAACMGLLPRRKKASRKI